MAKILHRLPSSVSPWFLWRGVLFATTLGVAAMQAEAQGEANAEHHDLPLPDLAEAAHFQAPFGIDGNCGFPRYRKFAIAAYVEQARELQLADVCQGQNSWYGNLKLEPDASGQVDVWFVFYSQVSDGAWQQEPITAAFQDINEIDRRFWQWQAGQTEPNHDQAVLVVTQDQPPKELWSRPSRTESNPFDSDWAVLGQGGQWELSTIAISQYPGVRFFADTNPLMEVSAELVERTLGRFQPAAQHRLRGTPDNIVTADRLVDFVRGRAAAAAAAGRLPVFYVAGHAVAYSGRDMWLLMDDFDIELALRLGRDVSVNEDLSQTPPGYVLPVSRLARAMAEAGTPYVLLLDACVTESSLELMRDIFDMQIAARDIEAELDPLGGLLADIESLTMFGDLLLYSERIDAFGFEHAIHFASNNVIVLATSPGYAAYFETLDPPVFSVERAAPMAAALARTVLRDRQTSLASAIHAMVRHERADPNAAIELVPEGTISWSRFGPFLSKFQ